MGGCQLGTLPQPADYAAVVKGAVGNLGCHLVFEPGRMLVGNAGTPSLSFLVQNSSGGLDRGTDLPLASPPVFNGAAAANGRLFISGADGSISCFGQQPTKVIP